MSEQDRTEKSNSIVQGETEEPQTNQMGICGLDTEHCKEVQSIGMARIPSEKDTIAGRPDRGQNPCGQIMKELQASYHRRKNVSFLRTVDQASHVVFIEIKHDE